jgi:hypothetical protein
MTARQIMHEIETLPFEEQRKVLSSLRQRLEENAPVADQDKALRIADRILTERAELFQKLAQ